METINNLSKYLHQSFQYFDSKMLNDSFGNLISSAILLLLLVIARIALLKTMRSWDWMENKTKKRLIFQLKNLTFLILVLGLIIIWAQELRAVALSLVAIAVAIVLATKEMLLCFLGGIYKISSRPFEIGDRIEVSNYRGTVTDHNVLTTTLFEIVPTGQGHQHTGRMVSIPNSLFLNNAIVNENTIKKFVLHLFSIPFKIEEDWEKAKKLLLKISEEACKSYTREAKKKLGRISEELGVEHINLNPSITVQFTSATEIKFLIRVSVPFLDRSAVEQQIKQNFLSLYFTKSKRKKKK